ncbi:hypothetical protein [Limnohabitans sp. TEGF004]|uniref:hypothetical protein n=1 Tax=Limnohabitans sp. TEGF004 TaxID=2986281 RepID=UPI00248FE8F2|nr:hypothetical protein [Limnohabitans sp. TEGF004]
MMILVLVIEKLATSLYEAHYTDFSGIEVRAASQHESIADALLYCGQDVPSEFAQYVEIQYGGINSGTTSISNLRIKSIELAADLVAMVAQVAGPTK